MARRCHYSRSPHSRTLETRTTSGQWTGDSSRVPPYTIRSTHTCHNYCKIWRAQDDGRLRGTTTSSTHLVKPPDSQMMHRAAVYRLSSQARARGAGRKVARKHRPRPSESGSEVESDVSVTLHGWNRQSSDVMEAMAEADFASEDGEGRAVKLTPNLFHMGWP